MQPLKRALRSSFAIITGIAALAMPAGARHAHGQASSTGDSATVAAVVHQYHEALASGDSAAALRLLAEDAVILESGGIESRTEYRAHHLQSDIAFARSVKSERGPIRVAVRNDVAWATSTSKTTGQYGDRAINSAGAELMVLIKTPAGWRISAIHWSSRNVRPLSGM